MVQAFDFSKTPTPPKKNHARFSFEYRVQYARQLMYDLWRGRPDPADTVIRHRDLAEDWHRREVAASVGMVYLVRELDGLLNSTFRDLWTIRPDLLQEWVDRRTRSIDEPSKPLSLSVSFQELWQPSTKGIPLEAYFRSRVLDEWYRTTGKPKVLGIQDILLGAPGHGKKSKGDLESGRKRRGGFPTTKLDVILKGIEHRNRFVHPSRDEEDWMGGTSRHGRLQKESGDTKPPDFDEFAEVLVDFADWIHEGVKGVTGEWIATNLPDLSSLLTEKQKAVFGLRIEFQLLSGRRYSTFQELVNEIELLRKRGEKGPRCFVLGTHDEVTSGLQRIREYLASHKKAKMLLCEDGWGSSPISPHSSKIQELLDMEQAFGSRFRYVPSVRYVPDPKPDLPKRVKPDPRYSGKKALQDAMRRALGL